MSNSKTYVCRINKHLTIEVTKLGVFNYVARPAGANTSVGTSPFFWVATYGRSLTAAKDKFLINYAEDIEKLLENTKNS